MSYFRFKSLTFALLLALTPSINADELEFDTGFLKNFDGLLLNNTSILSTSLKEQGISPGSYLVSVYVNQEYFGQHDLVFTQQSPRELTPCLSPSLLTEMGIKTDTLLAAGPVPAQCIDLPAQLEDARVRFDSHKLVLHISVPQIAIASDARGYVPSVDWDSGINAGFVNYQLSGSQSRNQASNDASYNLYLNGGVNLGDWRLRSSSSYSKTGQWEHPSTFAQRDLPGTAGTLTLGESTTAGDMFQSIPFRGVQLSTDIDMLPDSLQGYAPIIHGIAQTRAKVEIRQNGYSLYSTYVSPGPFEIRDLSAATGSGDLEVIITEADGREQRFVQPYATLGNLLRQGTWRYGLTAGEYNPNNSDIKRPMFTQASLAYGLANDYTLSGGGLIGESYRAWQLGLGKGLGVLGAISLDLTHSTTGTHEGMQSGQSYGIRYGKAFDNGTSIRFAGYRYSTEGYRDFGEAMDEQRIEQTTQQAYRGTSKRSRLEANVSQSLDQLASLYLNLTQQDYWGSSRQERQLQFGISTSVSRVNIGLYASKSLSDDNREGAQVALTLNFPLGRQNASGGLSLNGDGTYDQRIGLSGMAGRSNNFNYSTDFSRNEQSPNTGSASVGYRSPWAYLSAGGTSSNEYKSLSLGISGSLLAHADGIQLGQTMGETVGLLEVKNTPNVGVDNAPGQLTNSQGYSVIPYLQPYRKNRISLDTSQLDNDVDIDSGVTTVIPRRGAVVVASFKASRVDKILATVKKSDGTYLPFGAAVIDRQGNKADMIGQAGQVLLSITSPGEFTSTWGDENNEHCQFTIDPVGAQVLEGMKVLQATCQ